MINAIQKSPVVLSPPIHGRRLYSPLEQKRPPQTPTGIATRPPGNCGAGFSCTIIDDQGLATTAETENAVILATETLQIGLCGQTIPHFFCLTDKSILGCAFMAEHSIARLQLKGETTPPATAVDTFVSRSAHLTNAYYVSCRE